MTIEHAIDVLAGNYGIPGSTADWTDIADTMKQIVLVNLANYVSPTVYFEVNWASTAANAQARLYNVTDGAVVAGSAVSGSSLNRVRSGAITLPAGDKEYKIQVINPGLSISDLNNIKIIVVDSYGSLTTLQHQIEIVLPVSHTSTTYIDVYASGYYNWDNIKFDGSVTIYYEAVLYCAKAKAVYSQLVDSAGVAVAGSEVTVTATTPTRIRSSAITLTAGVDYKPQIKTPLGNEMRITAAKIIIVQTGTPITKTQVIKRVGYSQSSSFTSAQRVYCAILYTQANFPTLTIYFESTLKVGDVNDIANADLYDVTGAASVVGSPISHTGDLIATRTRSAAISLTNAREYDGRLWKGGFGVGSAYGFTFFVIFDCTIVAVAAILRRNLVGVGL